MALWHIPGQGIVDDAEGNIPEPGSFTLPDGSEITWGIAGTQRLPEYRNAAQYGDDTFAWDPALRAWRGSMPQTSPGYVTELLGLRDRVRAGQAQPWEVEQYQQWEQQARAIPTRDIGSLTAGWQGEYAGEHANQDWWTSLDPGSPDVGGIVLSLRDKLEAGQATPQERALYNQVVGMAGDWNYRASVPQASDAFSPLGDNLMGALGVLGLGATGGLAAAPLFAGGAGLATTLGSLGTLSGIAGTGAGVLGQALDQPWLRNVGLGLGIAGGLAGGLGGLSNVLGSGVNTLGDAARLAQSAGRITGSLGRIPGADPLQQASRYLGLAGQLGQGASGVQGLFGAAQGVTEGAGQVAQTAQDLVTQRGGDMSEWYDLGGGDFPGDYYAGGSSTFNEGGGAWDLSGYGTPNTGMPYSMDINDYTTPAGNWYQDTGQYIGGSDLAGAGGGGLWNTLLGGLGSVGGFLGRNASWLGPAASGLAGLGAGALGSNAAQDAARLQTSALNRGLDLQTAQWLQQQANQAPWLEAGRTALGHMAGRSTWEQPTLQQTGPISGANYAMPGATPGWSPQRYAGYTPTDVPSAAGYRYTPGQGPQAANYRYTPGQIPGAADYRYTPGAVPTLSGQALLANDPGVQFRLDRARNALEGSAAARGSALSGPALAALQEQGQDLASQEYGNAWQRASQQAQMREGWAQTASQMGFGQAMSEAQLREQVNQVASQQGWSQAQAEAAFREQLAQQAGAQNWGQALQESNARAQQQQFGWEAGFRGQQAGSQEQQNWWNQLYGNQMQQNQLQYGRDWQQREAENARLAQAYEAQRLNRNTAWNQFASLAGTGQTALGQLGTGGQNAANSMGNLLTQLGGAQGQGALSSGNSWLNALQNVGTAAQGAFGNMDFQNQFTSLLANPQFRNLLAGLNR
jgi:hypothetical protein